MGFLCYRGAWSPKGNNYKSVIKWYRAACKICICVFLDVCVFLNGWSRFRKSCSKSPTSWKSTVVT